MKDPKTNRQRFIVVTFAKWLFLAFLAILTVDLAFRQYSDLGIAVGLFWAFMGARTAQKYYRGPILAEIQEKRQERDRRKFREEYERAKAGRGRSPIDLEALKREMN